MERFDEKSGLWLPSQPPQPVQLSQPQPQSRRRKIRQMLPMLLAIVLLAVIAAVVGTIFFNGGQPQGQPSAVKQPAAATQPQAPAVAPAERPGLTYFPQREKGKELDLGEPLKISLPGFDIPGQQKKIGSANNGGGGFSVPIFSGAWEAVSGPLNVVRFLAEHWWLVLIVFFLVPTMIGWIIKKLAWIFPLLILERFQTAVIGRKENREKEKESRY